MVPLHVDENPRGWLRFVASCQLPRLLILTIVIVCYHYFIAITGVSTVVLAIIAQGVKTGNSEDTTCP